jgi:hypothetical protein
MNSSVKDWLVWHLWGECVGNVQGVYLLGTFLTIFPSPSFFLVFGGAWGGGLEQMNSQFIPVSPHNILQGRASRPFSTGKKSIQQHPRSTPRWILVHFKLKFPVLYSEETLRSLLRASSTRTLWAPCNVSLQVGPGGTCPNALQRSLHPSLQCRGPCLRGCSPCTFQRFAAHCTSRSTCLVVATMALTEAAKARKGRNFSPDEERQLCRSCLHVSQDPICGNGQRSTAFWERILKHYNDHRPTGCDPRPSRSLETKWGLIKHDVAKFCGVYKSVAALNESGTSAQDVLERSLELYKVKHPKQLSFNFLHCWLLLKDVPRWWDSPVEVQQRNSRKERPPAAMTKRQTPEVPTSAYEETGTGEDDDIEIIPETNFAKRPSRPMGNKVAKEENRLAKQREGAVKAQAKATAEMAAANMRKAQILHDQATLSLFTMPNEDSLSELACEYLHLRREEEMENLKCRIAERKAVTVKAAEEARKLADSRAAEVATATRNRVPRPPQRDPP